MFLFSGLCLKNACHILFECAHKELTALIWLVSLPGSNGDLDPWSGGGVTEDLSDTLVVGSIPEGAHHLDLRSSTDTDPPSLQLARTVEVQHIMQWITDFYGNYRRLP